MDDNTFKGTTTVGLVCDNGVVLASESRATMGNFIASRTAKKIYMINEKTGMTTAGGVGDAQALVRMISAESNLYRMRTKAPMTIKAITSLMSNVLSGSRYYPYYVQLLMGGMDAKGPSLYSLDALGGQIEERAAVATGSGSPIAYGVLEDRYHKNMPIDEGVDLAIRAIHNAMKRDSASGNGISVVKITNEGYEDIDEDWIVEVISNLA